MFYLTCWSGMFYLLHYHYHSFMPFATQRRKDGIVGDDLADVNLPKKPETLYKVRIRGSLVQILHTT